MSSRINTGQKLLQKLVGSRVITPSGADWAVVAADPFHDVELPNLCGYPDTQVGQSVVLKVPYQMTLSAPAGIGASDTWQFMLSTLPWTAGDVGPGPIWTDYKLTGNFLEFDPGPLNSATRLPPVSIYAGPSGTSLGPFQLSVAGNAAPQGLALDNSFAKGSHRVIGWGVEVYDTTAVISRQGTCTVWKQNTNTQDKSTFFYANPSGTIKNWGATSGILINRPPETIAEANLLAGTRSWKSEEGCYLVCTQNQEQLLAKQPNDTQPVMLSGDVSPGLRGPIPARALSGTVSTAPMGEDGIFYPSMVWNMIPYHMSGCFFTGLSATSTFLIRTIFYVERFPTPDEKDIVLLTKPSACHDPVALEIYDRMLKEMPVGVPVAENGLGEWFYDAIKAVMPTIAKIPHPLAQAAAGLGNMYSDYWESQDKPPVRPPQQTKKLTGQRNPSAPPRQTSPPATPLTKPQTQNRNNKKKKNGKRPVIKQ